MPINTKFKKISLLFLQKNVKSSKNSKKQKTHHVPRPAGRSLSPKAREEWSERGRRTPLSPVNKKINKNIMKTARNNYKTGGEHCENEHSVRLGYLPRTWVLASRPCVAVSTAARTPNPPPHSNYRNTLQYAFILYGWMYCAITIRTSPRGAHFVPCGQSNRAI